MTAPNPVQDNPSTYPERVGRYELLLPIGTGGMATVHLARTRVVGELHREVALKLMHAHFLAEDGEWATHLLEEAKLAARIRHPNVVAVLEVGEGPHGVFLVMEYVEGDTLSGLIRAARQRGETLPLPIAGRILVDALSGLHAAHELTENGERLDLVHRDFSPQNILVGVDGVSRLTDFGIAKAAGRVGVTSSGIIKGKVGYMAPEQALGKKVDRRCDVWAAGVVAWELLSGTRLYKQEDQVSTLLRIVQEAPPKLSTVRPDVPRALEQVVAQALTMDVDKRIASATDLRKKLLEAWRNEGELADVGEVGDVVRDLAKPKLDKRKKQVSQVLELRAKMANVSRSAISAADDGSTPSYAQRDDATGISSPSEVVGLHSLPPIEPRPSSKKTLVATAGAVGAVLAVGITLWAASRTSASAPAIEAPPATARAPAVALVPLASASATPPAVQPLVVRADSPIAALTIAGRNLAFEPASREVKVSLTPTERQGQLRVAARSADGRKVELDFAGDTESLEIAFPAPVPVARPKRAVRHSAPKRPEPPGLAPTPYGSQ